MRKSNFKKKVVSRHVNSKDIFIINVHFYNYVKL